MLGGGGAAGPGHAPRPVVHPPTRPEVGLALPGECEKVTVEDGGLADMYES